jgi:hypothetical protein
MKVVIKDLALEKQRIQDTRERIMLRYVGRVQWVFAYT